jgi:hypothetical protein
MREELMRLDRSGFELRASGLLPLLAAACLSAGCFGDHLPPEWLDPDAEPPSGSHAHTFYVRPSGDDANSGTSPLEAWKTLGRVNEQDLEPGDTVLLESGKHFTGTLELDAADSGSRHAPVLVSSFGDDRAVIEAGAADAISITNASYVSVEQLVLVGAWNANDQAGNDGEGVRATGTIMGTRRKGLTLRGLEIRGFKLAGIGLHARPEQDVKDSGYEDVEIRDCEVHENGDFGVLSDGPYIYDGPGYSHADVHVRGVRSHHNLGLKHKGEHTGSGIVLSDVEGAVIEHSIAHHNGEFNDHEGGGGFGIWAWDSDRVVIQNSESYDNRTSTSDGGGFDLDGGVTRSVMQYNYSHGNQGAGYGAFQFAFARPYFENLIQYNISQDDGFSFLVWDGNEDMGSLDVVQNVGYTSNPALVTYSAFADVSFINNVFYAHGPTLFDVFDGTAMTLQGNDYWTADAPFTIAWNIGTSEPVTYTSFEEYRIATGVETLEGEVTGLNVDPGLIAAGTGPTLDDTSGLPTLTMYQLTMTSPLIDRGLDPAKFEIDAATRDFFGGRSPKGEAKDIGVHELR